MKEFLVNRSMIGRRFMFLFVAVLCSLLGCEPSGSSNAASTAQARGSEDGRHSPGLMSGPVRDLSQDESAGGHILRKHVGKSDDDLRERLDRERNISGASTYTDRPTAEHAVGAAIVGSRNRIENWLSRPGRHANLVLDYDSPEPIGRTINRGEDHSHPCSHALVVLKYVGPNDYYVLTSYPECR